MILSSLPTGSQILYTVKSNTCKLYWGRILTFIQSIKKVTQIPVEVWDERLSTVAVSRTLLEANVSRRRKEVVDKLAAVYILQGY